MDRTPTRARRPSQGKNQSFASNAYKSDKREPNIPETEESEKDLLPEIMEGQDDDPEEAEDAEELETNETPLDDKPGKSSYNSLRVRLRKTYGDKKNAHPLTASFLDMIEADLKGLAEKGIDARERRTRSNALKETVRLLESLNSQKPDTAKSGEDLTKLSNDELDARIAEMESILGRGKRFPEPLRIND
jgi:hypothetical protein